jgi:hypothetical protein
MAMAGTGGTSGGATKVPKARAPTAVNAPATPLATGASGARPRNGCCASQERGPMASRSFPSPMLRNARTMTGSKWVPADRASSWRASSAGTGCLYEREAVMTSKASATATMRAAREISSPFRPRG